MNSMPPVCILAGGVGSRLGSRVAEVPKPLLPVAGKPFLVHQMRQLADAGVERVVLCVGYLGRRIEQRLGRRQFDVSIEYSFDGPGLDGTLGAIRRAANLLGERFLVLYGDTYLQLDFRAAYDAWHRSNLPGLMTVLRNEGRWDTSNVWFSNGLVLAHDKVTLTPHMHWIDYGLGGLTAGSLNLVPQGERDLACLYSHLAERRELYGYEAHERFYEIGRPESLAETEAFLRARQRPERPSSTG
jgi:NDP-sugar pyrophosphorylase family protein